MTQTIITTELSDRPTLVPRNIRWAQDVQPGMILPAANGPLMTWAVESVEIGYDTVTYTSNGETATAPYGALIQIVGSFNL